MKIISISGCDYKLPNSLNAFQMELYVHLIDWKWQHITNEPGIDGGIEYDAILPESCRGQYPMLYPGVKQAVYDHLQAFPFRIHTYFNHMASSQAANINLFLPVLLHPAADRILGAIKPDFATLARGELDQGYRIEFWDEPFGNLNDKTDVSGTDTDIAIAYLNHQGEYCLWLIEHKLTETEFTTCGGYRSKGRLPKHNCDQPFADILANKDTCYYHEKCGFQYWKITEANRAFFVNYAQYAHCLFRGGMNQLWRNQLLGLSIEQDKRQPYQHVYFSVVRHPRNKSLDRTIREYQDLIAYNPKFSAFTSADVVSAAEKQHDKELDRWIVWYRDLYDL